MEVELLFWEGCPSHPAALAELRAALGEGIEVVVREINDSEQAVVEHFPGSPTIRVDGADLFPSDDPPSLTCRVYRLADGRFSPRLTLARCARPWSGPSENPQVADGVRRGEPARAGSREHEAGDRFAGRRAVEGRIDLHVPKRTGSTRQWLMWTSIVRA